MFKIPVWEDNVPESKATFIPNTTNTKKKKTKSISSNADDNQDKNKNKIKTPPRKRQHETKESNKTIVKKKKVMLGNNALQSRQSTINLKIYKKNNNNTETKQLNAAKNNNNKMHKSQSNAIKKINSKTEKDTDSKSFLGTNFDEILLNAKKKKFNKVIEDDDKEEVLFSDKKKNKSKKALKNKNSIDIIRSMYEEVKPDSSKLRLKSLMDKSSTRSHINVSKTANKLRERMLDRLKAAQFRYLNEKLYTSSGTEAQQLFQTDPEAFQTYHQGYQLQVKKWPVNPLDVIVKRINKMPKSHLIADMGCGEAALSKRIAHNVRSFDLVATAPGVEVCDMARTPLLTASVDVTVYCLALMGTDLTQYLLEANRVLKMGGNLLIAEVESRFDKVEDFAKEVERLGFKLNKLDKSNNVFFFMEFTKVRDPPVKKAKLPVLTLKPCLYKRR